MYFSFCYYENYQFQFSLFDKTEIKMFLRISFDHYDDFDSTFSI